MTILFFGLKVGEKSLLSVSGFWFTVSGCSSGKFTRALHYFTLRGRAAVRVAGIFVGMKFICLTSLLIALCLSGFCQEPDEENMRENALKVFMDCPFCDLSYVRSHINYVNYVRDTRLAQVHVLGTSQRTGSGGTEYTFNFIGLQDFAGQNDTLKAVVRADATQDERRELRLKYLKIGLTRYVAQTPMIEFMDVTYTDEADTTSAEDAVDKWDFWVFRLRGNGWFNGEELYESKRFNGSISANRVTELWKFENWGFANYNENKYQAG